jgi:excisionase family DNA binding protein
MPRSTAKQSRLSSAGIGHNQPPEPLLPDVFDGRLTVSVDETAAALGIGRDSVYLMLQRGDLTASKFGTRTVVHVASIRTLLAATKFRPPPRAKALARAAKARAKHQEQPTTGDAP